MDPSPKIIPALYARQQARGGYLTREDKEAVARETGASPYRIQALVTFFPHFRESPPPRVQLDICRDMSCHLRGSVAMTQRLAKRLQPHGAEVSVCGVSCLGRCDRAPAAMINEDLFVAREEDELCEIVESYLAGSPWAADSDVAHVTGRTDDWQINCYEGSSDYAAVRGYLRDPNPWRLFGTESDGPDDAGTLEARPLGALTTAGLLGMGGAGGRAYLKWRDVYLAQGEDKFIVCNADESEPGTFKDRDLLLAFPHLTIEGMILAGLSIGASRGWVYIRHEYHDPAEAVRAEISRARKLGALGHNIFGSGKSFELEVFVSPGGYICGEQTALIEAMEDQRAEPRNRPPELMTNGLHNQPTLLSNVETFAWVPAILQRQAAPPLHQPGGWYAAQGRKEGRWVAGQGERMKGRRLFSISGDVARPGVYEVPTGLTLGELIDEYAQGTREGRALVAAALSGPSGGLLPAQLPTNQLARRFVDKFVPADVTHIDLREIPLDINVSRALGIMIGAGIVIYAEGADILREALACSRFFQRETCGKCVPCRLGSKRITEMGERLVSGRILPEQLPVLVRTANELSEIMIATSICGLGQVASNPVRGLLRFFPELVRDAVGAEETR